MKKARKTESNTIRRGDLSCEIAINQSEALVSGTVKYRAYEVGTVSGATTEAIAGQFLSICELVNDGSMVRDGTIMTGYHNEISGGDVLLLDGEIVGQWRSDEEGWCHFVAYSATEITCSAPSPWLLQDTIFEWLSDGKTD
ncbi:hypothetical protein OAN307_c18470 [Octadecabacter antarcticus 307]|uniref:YopX protein domain-containing protein n=1 Tax=Octadecabacter antarcticus 307 TaxID=391626 RepID=M9R6X3_9RHOB|nr:hypothetical protein OAN307_c18470 [Octadecabacter antarcticus 307]